MNRAKESYAIQQKLMILIVLLFFIKIVAWYLTNSVAVLTDAIEYTINVISGFVALYSLRLSAKPRDKNHPYGHGKIEFLSATIEGTLMVISGFLILYEAMLNLKHPHLITKLDYGIILIALTGAINYIAGVFIIKKGKKNNSLALTATGNHLVSDTYATIGVVLGLLLMMWTKFAWIDSLMAVVFAILIIISGYKILKSSIAGIMDEADNEILSQVVACLEEHRKENWVDLHNLRIIKYGSTLHLDCHLTAPWFLNVREAHKEIDALENLIKINFGESVELFVHTDSCLDFSCAICNKKNCVERKTAFAKKVIWTVENISSNQKHNEKTL